jgi:hypothetical protein
MTYTAISVIGMDVYAAMDKIVCQSRLQCCQMVITICQKLVRLFLPTWQHHHQIIASIIASIIQWQTSMIARDQYGTANPRLDASLLPCTRRSSRCTGGGNMPNRLQWWRDRVKHDYALIGAVIVAFLLVALIWFLWVAPDLAMYFATGLIRLPVF